MTDPTATRREEDDALGERGRGGANGWARAVAAVVLIAVLLVATAAGLRFVQSDPLPAPHDNPADAVLPFQSGA